MGLIRILQVNQAIRRMDDGDWIRYFDIGHRFLEDDGSISKEIMPDFLHLSRLGYEIWADSIEKPLARLLGVEAKSAAPDVSGEWTWSMKGPEDRMVESRVVFRTDGRTLTGTFHMREDRELKIEEGKAEGDRLSFVVRRDRPSGGEMVYRMKAVVKGKRMEGEVTTRFNDEEVTRPWQAVRK